MAISSTFRWLGPTVMAGVLADVDRRLTRAGSIWLAEADRRAPVDTGALRSSLYFRVSPDTRTLVLGVGHPGPATLGYAEYQEWGTRSMRARPYFRPAIPAALRAIGVVVTISWQLAPRSAAYARRGRPRPAGGPGRAGPRRRSRTAARRIVP